MDYRENGKNSDVIYGGGELIRQRSIYPGRGNSDYDTQQSTTALLSSNTSLNILNGIPVDRQDSDNFSWSGLFSINSIDGYGMISSSSDNNFSLSSPGGSINLTNTINSINENNNIKIKEEIIREEKHIKRGIAELGSNDEIQYNDKNNDNRDNNFRRQKLSTSFPLVNSQVVGASSNNSLNTIINSGTNNNSNINQMQNLGSGSMDPPSGYYSQSGNESTQFGKQETSEPFYGNFQRNNPSEVSFYFYFFFILCSHFHIFYYILAYFFKKIYLFTLTTTFFFFFSFSINLILLQILFLFFFVYQLCSL